MAKNILNGHTIYQNGYKFSSALKHAIAFNNVGVVVVNLEVVGVS
jgi:hypothetical protein